MSAKSDERMRLRLTALADEVRTWCKAIDHVDPACRCRLAEQPGFQALDNVDCRSGRRCLGMTVLVVRTHMGMLRLNTRHLAAAQVPPMLADLKALFDELPTTTAWRPFAERLAATLDTGRDPSRNPAEGAPPS